MICAKRSAQCIKVSAIAISLILTCFGCEKKPRVIADGPRGVILETYIKKPGDDTSCTLMLDTMPPIERQVRLNQPTTLTVTMLWDVDDNSPTSRLKVDVMDSSIRFTTTVLLRLERRRYVGQLEMTLPTSWISESERRSSK